MKTHWYISDHHISHENIIGFCDRPFKNVKEMDEALLDYHNETVDPQDTVYFLGDVTLRRGSKSVQDWFIKEIKRYNGRKILFKGNHDHFPIKTYILAGFEDVRATWRDDENIIYSHFPLHPSSLGTVRANVHGHIHDQNSPPPATWLNKVTGELHVAPYINVSCEKTDYTPISLDEIEIRIDLARKKMDIDSTYPLARES